MKTNSSTRLGMGFTLLLATVLGGSLSSCRDQALNDLSTDDSQVYITNYDRSVNFGQFSTYSLPDSIIIESNEQVNTSLGALEGRFIDQVAGALTSRGFQRVGIGQPADLGVAIIRVNNRYTGVTTNPYAGYYTNYWYGGGFGGYNPYFPSYPNYYQFYTVRDQFWQIQIVNLRNQPTGGTAEQPQLPVVFQADIRGASLTDEQAVDKAIQAIFAQSPFLKAAQ